MSAEPDAPKERGPDDLGFALPAPARMSAARALALMAIAVTIGVAAVVLGVLPRQRAREALASEKGSAPMGPAKVDVITPKVLASDRALMLPASVQALEETTLYARATGYVSKWYFDLGDVVKEGDVLADIDTPETDRELAQARASLRKAEAGGVQAKALSDKADLELLRTEKLAQQGLSSQQDLDQKKADVLVAHANVSVASAATQAEVANVARLVQLKAYSKILAPFAGTITMRSISRGMLVTAGSTAGATQALYKIAATDTVRVVVQVPQGSAPGVTVGIGAKVIVREFPTKNFDGKVTRLAGALDPQSRTMTTEVRVSNGDHVLIPGMYVQVSLSLPVPHKVFEIPSTALLNDAKGTRVAVVDTAGTVRLVPVVIERDTGATFEIASGLSATDRVIRLATVDLYDGQHVEVAAPSK